MKYVYLAGGKDSGWRQKLKDRWRDRADLTLIDPFLDSRQGAVYEFTQDDLEWVGKADLIFGLTDYPTYTGTALEFGYAHALGKPIVYVTYLSRVDSMMAAVASATFTDLDVAADFAERYLRPRQRLRAEADLGMGAS